MADILITVNTQADGVSRKVVEEGSEVQDVLGSTDTDTASVMVNGESATLDQVLVEGDRVVVTKDGKNNS